MNSRKFNRTEKGQQDALLLKVERGKNLQLNVQLQQIMRGYVELCMILDKALPDIGIMDAVEAGMKKRKHPTQTIAEMMPQIKERIEHES